MTTENNWKETGRRLGNLLKEEGISQSLIDQLDDYILEALWLGYQQGAKPLESGPISADVLSDLATPLGQIFDEVAGKVAGTHGFKDGGIHERRRDTTGRLL